MSRMKKKLDFVIKEDDNSRLIFRFYPRQSSCHSFNDKPPQSWSNVYKVYYAYSVIKQWRFNLDEECESVILFEEPCDECSIIDEIGQRCLLLADGTEVFKREDGRKFNLLDQRIYPCGMGTEWTISKREWEDFEDEDIIHTFYTFTLFDWSDVGFRFCLDKEQMKDFGQYLLDCCEYMLEHGVPI